MIAARLGVPVVPVRLEGLDRILHHSSLERGPRARGAALESVRFGAPIVVEAAIDYAAIWQRQVASEPVVRHVSRSATTAEFADCGRKCGTIFDWKG